MTPRPASSSSTTAVGNVHSAVRALERVGAEVELTGDREAALAADGLFVPGVGNFHACVAGCVQADGAASSTSARRRPPGPRGLRRDAGAVRRLDRARAPDRPRRAWASGRAWSSGCRAEVVPHMGWSTVKPPAGTRLFAGVEDERFYFVHSYAAQQWSLYPAGTFAAVAPIVTWSTHGGPTSSPPSRTARSARPSSTRRSPATPALSCWRTG